MANTIKIKRRPASGAAGKPSSLLNGELAFNENDNILYYGLGSGVAGAATGIEQIGGSGYFSHRGGTNASGVWPISVTGNSATVTNGVYTTGNQTIGGQKTFSGSGMVQGAFKAAYSPTGNYNVIFSPTQIFIGQGDIDVKLAGNAYYDPNGVYGPTKEIVNREYVTGALSGITFTAGSGLVNGGTLVASRTFDVGQGDGITVSSDAISVDNTVVRTSGNQTISGVKTFGSQTIFGGSGINNPLVNLIRSNGQDVIQMSSAGLQIFKEGLTNSFTNAIIIQDNSANEYFTVGQSGTLALRSINTSSNNVGYFAVFDSNPASSTQTLKSVSKSDVLDDIGGASSGIDMTAGSGLVGGGDLSASRTFNVGQGDGISVSADAIAVNSTVVRTTGNQDIVGVKRFFESSNNNIIFSTFNDKIYVKAPNTSDSTQYFLGLDGGGSPPDANSADRSLVSRSTSQVKTDLNLNNVENLALSGITFTAGSGLVGGGTLAANRTFDINTGDGIQIVSDAVAVDSTVVRTTGTQTIAGVKTLSNRPVLNSGLSVLMVSTASSGSHFPVFTSDPSSAAQVLAHRTSSQVKGDIGLSNVTNDAQIKKLASTSGGFIPTWNGTTGDALNIGYSVETTLTGGAGALPRADAVKTYVDNMIVSGIATNDAMIFKGAIDCSTNPNYPSGDRGWVYKINVAGKIGGASGPVVEVNDTIICGTDGSPSGIHSVVGGNWNILQTNIVDASILVTGPSSATSGNIAMFDGATGKIIKDGGFLASNIVLTTGTQTINGSKTFADGLTVGNNVGNLLAGTSGVRFTHPQINFQIDAGNLSPGFDGDALRLDIDDANGTGYITTLKTSAPSSDIILRLPSSSGVLARLEDITTTNITGVLAATKGGTGQSLYAIGDLLYANTTTSLAKLADVATGNVLLAGGVATAPSWGKVGLTTHVSGTLPVANGGTAQTSYTDGQLLIGNTTGNTLTKATLTQGSGIAITNGNGSISIAHAATSSLTGAQGPSGIASITVDGQGHVTAVTTATFLTAGTVCAAIVDCTLDGGSF